MGRGECLVHPWPPLYMGRGECLVHPWPLLKVASRRVGTGGCPPTAPLSLLEVSRYSQSDGQSTPEEGASPANSQQSVQSIEGGVCKKTDHAGGLSCSQIRICLSGGFQIYPLVIRLLRNWITSMA
jgi:hypothetical protein